MIFLAVAVLIISAGAKFARVPQVTGQLAAVGFSGSKLMIIATLEILSALLFLFPRTRSLGLLLVSAYLGGAIATHFGHNESVLPPALILALFWTGAWLRSPDIFAALSQSSSRSGNSKIPGPIKAS
jgi:hypothetical protein